MEKIKGCDKHGMAKQGCQSCNGRIGNYHGRQKKIDKLIGMIKAYGPAGNPEMQSEIDKLLLEQNQNTL